MLFGELAPGEEYLYHYTKAETARLILESGVLRMGPYSGTNDPRESRLWYPGLMGDVDFSHDDFQGLIADFNEATRARIKLSCLSVDGPPSHPIHGVHANRGFARPRMWAQYGDSHRGVCLIFRKAELDRAFRDLIQGERYAWSGRVDYSGARLGDNRGVFILNASDVRSLGARQASLNFVEENRDTMLFSKNPDWMTEAEFRYVLMSDHEFESLVVAAGIAGVVCGLDISPEDADLLETLAAQWHVPIAKAHWMNGLCDPLPFFQDQPDNNQGPGEVAAMEGMTGIEPA